jgi:hypothetical protein
MVQGMNWIPLFALEFYHHCSKHVGPSTLKIDHISSAMHSIELYCFCSFAIFWNAGYSVCCNIHGFEPYFYISCLDGIGPDDVPKFRTTLEVRR